MTFLESQLWSLAFTCTSSGTPMRAQGVPHRLCIGPDVVLAKIVLTFRSS
jgi:hypothetical protein